MAKTNWQDPKTGEIISPHISGLQEAVGKIEESIGIDTVAEINIPLSEVFISNDDRCRIFQAPEGKRNWLLSPTPVIKKNGIIITNDFEIDYGGGAVIFTTPILESDILTADATYTKKIDGKQLSTNDYSNEEKLKNQNNKDDIVNLSETVGDTTIDDTLVPSSDTGLSVKILLSWLGNMIKSITGKASWRTEPTKNLEELNTALTTHEADNMFKVMQVTRDMSIAGIQQVQLGFKPDAIIIFANVDDTKKFSIGQATENDQQHLSLADGGSLEGTFRGAGSYPIKISDSTSNFTYGVVSFQDNGIGITWGKNGNGGTGVARLQIMAFRH